MTGTHGQDDVARRAGWGLVWGMLAASGTKVLALVTQYILAFFLTPAAFAVAGVIAAWSSVVFLVGSSGLRLTLSRPQARPLDHQQASWLALAQDSAAGFLLVVCWIAVTRVGGDAPGLRFVSLAVVAGLLQALSVASSAQLAAKLRFGRLSSIHFGQALIRNLLAIPLAMAATGAYALLVPPLVSYAFAAWATNISERIPWRLPGLKSGLWALAREGLQINITSGLGLLNASLPIIALSFVLPLDAIGHYTWAAMAAGQAAYLLLSNLRTVVVPSFGLLSPAGQNTSYREVSHGLLFVSCLLAGLQAMVGPVIIEVAFGERWQAAAPLVYWLSLGVTALVLDVFVEGVYVSHGYVKTLLVVRLAQALFVGGIAFGLAGRVSLGAFTIATSMGGALSHVASFAYATAKMGANVPGFARSIVTPLCALALGAVSAEWVVRVAGRGPIPSAAALAVFVSTFAIVALLGDRGGVEGWLKRIRIGARGLRGGQRHA